MSITRHLADDEEFGIPIPQLLEHGKALFIANWTEQEGGGRPLVKGTGKALERSSKPLVVSRASNRSVRSRSANWCYGCRNAP